MLNRKKLFLFSVLILLLNSSMHAQSQMNQTAATLAATSSMGPNRSTASINVSNINNFFNSHLSDLITPNPIILNTPELDAVFSYPFYQVQLTISGCFRNIIVGRSTSKLIALPTLDTNKKLPEILVMIKPDFKLNSDMSAATLRTALNILFPEEKIHDSAVFHQDNQWVFITGNFFEFLKGFVFTTQQDGKINSAAFSLNLPKMLFVTKTPNSMPTPATQPATSNTLPPSATSPTQAEPVTPATTQPALTMPAPRMLQPTNL